MSKSLRALLTTVITFLIFLLGVLYGLPDEIDVGINVLNTLKKIAIDPVYAFEIAELSLIILKATLAFAIILSFLIALLRAITSLNIDI